ncbi:hypothetical protein F2Q68_00016836 [Brassica cretica]|uniref:Uncharacterized protein n=1 Tax=Brassica cretica TaxID=69181 RepID=A0A8S9HM93_BRACR|nr:hypothetical protein F2Q68_00016836 [Brassica cretica]
MSKRSSSSIPTTVDRARLKRRMKSPVSRSDSSPEAGEGYVCDLMAPLPLSCVYAAPPLVCAASSVSEDELAEWRSRYSLPYSIVLRVPTPEERASSYILREIAIYEAFFDSGLRGTIPALIAGLAKSPCLENPHSYPKLRRFGVSITCGLPIVEELPKSDRKGLVFNKKWQERYAFMVFPGSSYRWNFIAGTHHAPLEGEKAVLRARQLPADRRQGGITNDPFAAYQEAAKVMSAKKGSSSRSASGDEVMITGSRCSPVVKLEPSPPLPGKRPKSGGVTTRSAQQSADIARSVGSLATALSNLNLNVFPQDGTVLPIGDSSEVIQVLQGGLLRVNRFPAAPSWGATSDEGLLVLREEVKVLKRQVSEEKEQRVAREFEIHDLKEKVKDLEKVASSADVLAINQKNQELEGDIEALKMAAETFKFEMVMAVNGVRVVACWELMKEWLRKQSAQWDLVTVLEQYKAVVQEEARSKGAPLPTFEDEPAIPPSSDMDVDSFVKPRGSTT